MLEGLLHLFSARPARDILIDIVDLLVVTYVIYRALIVMRGTRAMQMGTGLGVIFIVYVVARWLNIVTLYNLLSSLLSSIILVVVVVFQNDIRRALMRVGARAFLGGISRQQESRVIDEVVSAATELARHRIGALICFEQDANLDEFVVGQGTLIDAQVQRELLVGIFLPESLNKLHDGSVVIRNLRIAKAGVFFPMPDTKVLDKSLGSRHRAALGITEETDAVVVVVSEERGTISFCFNGNIISNLDGASLRQALLGLFGQRARQKKKAPVKKGDRQTTGSYRFTVPPSSHAPQSSERVPPVGKAAAASAGPPSTERGADRATDRGVDRSIARDSFDDEAINSRPDPSPPRRLAPAKPIETPQPAPSALQGPPTSSNETDK
ncbi:diadenylate cyclase CdaA [Pendulispora albinea]|uniref:Diadenylate cyclase n=1 Tax=Pendulispora albinea TaxID=2741071 RepID=A0ABZ2M0V2_9BACT